MARLQGTHEYETGELTADAHEERVAARLSPIVIEVAVAEQPVFARFIVVELAIVVLAQFHEIMQNGLLLK